MERIQGNKDVPLVQLINPYIGKYRLRWDIQDEVIDMEQTPPTEVEGVPSEQETVERVTFYETDITTGMRKPHVFDVRAAILSAINKMTDEKILSGFRWKDMEVWLSQENQFNYKAAYDLAVQSNGATLPVTFKFGSNANPEYYKFEELEDLVEFYMASIDFIQEALNEGWRMKDSIDWEEYKKVLRGLK